VHGSIRLCYFCAHSRGWEQHDAQEYLVFLLYCLHEDLNRQTVKYTKAEVDEKLPPPEQALMDWQEEMKLTYSYLSDLMMGVFAHLILFNY
jgi:ubiquitin C-terminal hydrolase